MGPFTVLTIRAIHANADKVKLTYDLAPERHRSMRLLLESEVTAGMHQPGGTPLRIESKIYSPLYAPAAPV